ncbi:hypothetical protein R3P93_13375 [Rhodococcus cerastii]|uniref:Uncharacterized protein n=1 Tax=Rhodococcus cerastii TaxID=908616 RepID=A0ABU4D2D1_9NOCA|nr:hypothetical protein [Rhodococcus cerastii]MDV6303551.1 hypothetical protein [Rhodococcus cerastii]
MTVTLTTIDRAALTLLVLPARTLPVANLWQAYPIDLGESAAEIGDALHAVAWLNDITPDQLAIVGVEFADPEQHNTTVTLSGTDLDAMSWVLGDGGMALESTAGVLTQLERLASVAVPVYASMGVNELDQIAH